MFIKETDVMIVVSGCPRSGTSLTMNLMKSILGEERILGSEFPFEERQKPVIEDVIDENVSSKRKNAIKYSVKSNTNTAKILERQEKSRMMNPNGFFECQYSVRGINYNFHDRENLKKYENETDNVTCVKIVSQGLLPSDTRYFSKIIYVIRHPRAVAKSQENLGRMIEPLGKVHTPEKYINDTTAAAVFFKENPDIPVYFFNYDNLLANPEKYIKEIAKFVVKDPIEAWENAKNIVDQKLKRSNHEDIDNELWEDAEAIYDRFNEGNFQGVIDYMSDITRKINQHNVSWYCPRAGKQTNVNMCRSCIESSTVRTNFKAYCKQKDINWREEPCLFECGFDFSKTDEELKTIEESIQNNFWNHTEEPIYFVMPELGEDSINQSCDYPANTFSRSFQFDYSIADKKWRDSGESNSEVSLENGVWLLTLKINDFTAFIYKKDNGSDPTGNYSLSENNSDTCNPPKSIIVL